MGKQNFQPLSFWSFNGDMEDEEIRLQVRQFKEQGYGGFFMHARAGMTLEYLGSSWFHACRTAIEEAEKCGIKAWLYDENGWPSGFAGGLVPSLGDEYTAKHLYFIYRNPRESDGRVLASYQKKEDGTYIRVNEMEQADMHCCLGQLKGYADLMNGKAMDAFIHFTHERYKQEFGEYFGNVIPGIFTDEPQLVGKFPYTFNYPELFQKTYKYDFFDKAWMLCVDGYAYAEFKYQAAKLIATLLKENFTDKINTWCNEHNLIFTGHFSNEDGLCEQTNANYNLMLQYAHMERPGIDFLGRRLTSPVLTKQVSDAAYLNGKSVITSESFGCTGWDVTFNELMWISDWQAAFGINSIVTHLSAYSLKGRRKRDYPAFFSYQEPWWDIFKEVSDHIARVNDFMSEGKREINTLVLYPITSMWCMLAGKNRCSDESRFISNQFRLLIENLIDIQQEFLIVTEDEFARLTRADIPYETVLVSDCISLNQETYDRLLKFGESGGNVVFINRRPILCEGVSSEQAKKISSFLVENRRGLLEKYFLATGQAESIQIVDGYYGHAATGLIVFRKILLEETRIFVMNPSRSDTKDVYVKYNEATFCPLHLEPTESICLRISNVGVYTLNGEKLQIEEPKVIRKLQPTQIELLSPNAYTIKTCDVYLNGELLLEKVIPAICVDELYKRAYESGNCSHVKLIYRFQTAFKQEIPKNMVCVAESDGVSSVKINGKEVLYCKTDWWIDKSFHVFPIATYVQQGMNEISIEYTITRPKELDEQGEFEGYRNRFFYPVEPEDIYIRGDFDVKTDGTIQENIEAYRVEESFVLTDVTTKHAGELTKQNLWFYRGNVKYQYFFKPTRKRQHIHLKQMEGTAVKVFVNGAEAGIISRSPFKLEITSYIQEGENYMELILYGSNRNLLGPHHHVSDNPHFVGPLTFAGKKAWTDLIYPEIVEESTLVKGYSFVHLDIGQVILEETE